MKKLALIIFGLLLSFGPASNSLGQDPGQPDLGIKPFGSYLKADIYEVNLTNGNVYGQIPVSSYPQLGKLPPLTLLVNFNTTPFVQEETCFPYYDECYYYYDYGANSVGAQLTTSYSGGTVTGAQ